MAKTPSTQSPARTQPQSRSDLESAQYWCYHCDKRVTVETLPDLPDIVCHEFLFLLRFSNQVLRFIAQAAREEDSQSPLPFDPFDDDYLRIELDGWDNDDEDE